MSHPQQARKDYRLPMWAAEVAMILFSALAIAGIMGWLPVHGGRTAAPEIIVLIPEPVHRIAGALPRPTGATGTQSGVPGAAHASSKR